MTAWESDRARPITLGSFAVGIGVGFAVALITVLSAVIAFVLIGLLLATAVVAIFNRSIGPSWTAFLAGALTGVGGTFLFGAINTIQACLQTDNFCGQTVVWPLLTLALVLLVAGLIVSVVVVARLRRVTR
jgi:hypothetical protein